MINFSYLLDYAAKLQQLLLPMATARSILTTITLAIVIVLLSWLLSKPFYLKINGNKVMQRIIANLLFPFFAGFGLSIAYLIAQISLQLNAKLLSYALDLTSIAIFIRIVNGVISYTFAKKSYVQRLNKCLSLTILVIVIIITTESNHNIIEFLDNLTLVIGKNTKISVWDLMRACATIAIAFICAMFANRFSERKINQLSSIDANLQQIITRLSKILIFVVTLLVTLPLIGIDMTVLSVFGGAIGVGIGFGLQKITSNFLSGFIILLDRSIRIGDRLIVDNNSGTVTKITTRYVVLERADGTDVLIPNEKFVTDSIQNQSYSNLNLRVELAFTLDSTSNIEQGMQLIKEAMQSAPDILPIEPSIIINRLVVGGVELKAYFWVARATLITSSTNFIYLNILKKFKDHEIHGPDSIQQIKIVNYESPAPSNIKD